MTNRPPWPRWDFTSTVPRRRGHCPRPSARTGSWEGGHDVREEAPADDPARRARGWIRPGESETEEGHEEIRVDRGNSWDASWPRARHGGVALDATRSPLAGHVRRAVPARAHGDAEKRPRRRGALVPPPRALPPSRPCPWLPRPPSPPPSGGRPRPTRLAPWVRACAWRIPATGSPQTSPPPESKSRPAPPLGGCAMRGRATGRRLPPHSRSRQRPRRTGSSTVAAP